MENEVPKTDEEEQVRETQAPVAEAIPVSAPATPMHEEKLWAMGCHLVALIGYAIPIGSLIAPLVLWLIKREGNPFVDSQGKEAVNFQISILIYMVISAVLIPLLGLGILLMFAVGIFDLVMIIVAAIKANGGEDYRYPLCIRLIK